MRECCVLCTNYFDESDDKKVIELRCGHVFHEACFINWIKGKQANEYFCPTCEEPIVMKEEAKEFDE